MTSVDAVRDALIEAKFSYADADYFANLFGTVGIIFAVSGVLSIVAGIFSKMKRNFIIAFIACLLSSIIALVGVFGIIGLIITYFLYKSRYAFKGYNK